MKDRCVVVTGASRGLGRGCALAFAAEGAEVILIARSGDELARVEAEIRAAGGQARAVPCDVTRQENVERLFASLERCDVLINNAGTNRPQPFLEVDVGTLDSLLTLNVRSMFLTAQAAARIMARQGGGAIVNMSSQMGHVGAPDRTRCIRTRSCSNHCDTTSSALRCMKSSTIRPSSLRSSIATVSPSGGGGMYRPGISIGSSDMPSFANCRYASASRAETFAIDSQVLSKSLYVTSVV